MERLAETGVGKGEFSVAILAKNVLGDRFDEGVVERLGIAESGFGIGGVAAEVEMGADLPGEEAKSLGLGGGEFARGGIHDREDADGARFAWIGAADADGCAGEGAGVWRAGDFGEVAGAGIDREIGDAEEDGFAESESANGISAGYFEGQVADVSPGALASIIDKTKERDRSLSQERGEADPFIEKRVIGRIHGTKPPERLEAEDLVRRLGGRFGHGAVWYA